MRTVLSATGFSARASDRADIVRDVPGRAVARTGLRMMPTFPPLPLKSRTAGFTQYGFKAEISGGAFPSTTNASHGLPPPFVHLAFQRRILVLSRGTRCADTPPCKRLMPLYPRGPRSGPSCVVSAHHHLFGPMRPTRRHISISPTRFIQDALAVHLNSGA